MVHSAHGEPSIDRYLSVKRLQEGRRLLHERRVADGTGRRLFWAGQLVSLMGTGMQLVAQSWLVYRLTSSAFILGFTAFAGGGPVSGAVRS